MPGGGLCKGWGFGFGGGGGVFVIFLCMWDMGSLRVSDKVEGVSKQQRWAGVFKCSVKQM